MAKQVTRLSKTQRDVLEKLKAGSYLCAPMRLYQKYYLTKTKETVRESTFYALLLARCLRRHSSNSGNASYLTISAAGRKLLEKK